MQPEMVVLVKEALRQKRRRRRRKWEKSLQSCIPELAALGETTTRTAMRHF